MLPSSGTHRKPITAVLIPFVTYLLIYSYTSHLPSPLPPLVTCILAVIVLGMLLVLMDDRCPGEGSLLKTPSTHVYFLADHRPGLLRTTCHCFLTPSETIMFSGEKDRPSLSLFIALWL